MNANFINLAKKVQKLASMTRTEKDNIQAESKAHIMKPKETVMEPVRIFLFRFRREVVFSCKS